MKKLFALPVAALVALGACADADLPTAMATDAADLSASPTRVEVTATFALGSDGVGYDYIGENANVYCDASGLAWNEQSGGRVPGQDQFCVPAGGTTQYVIVWTAQYVQAAQLNLNFSNTPKGQVQKHHIQGVRGFNETPVGTVYEAGGTTALGTATAALTQFTGAGWGSNPAGHVCLNPAATAEASVTFHGDSPIVVDLGSFCW